MAHESKTYAAPWDGQLILACRKCQKKLKERPNLRALAKLKSAMRKRNKKHPQQPLYVLNVSCMDLCPKDGVTVCASERSPTRLRILWSEDDIDRMYFDRDK